MKRLCKYLSLLIAVLLLAGCAAPAEVEEGYRYVEKGDASYIVPDAKAAAYNSQSSGMVAAPHVIFTSVAEMKNDIQTGNFTEEEAKNVAGFAKDTSGNIKVCSVDSLWEPRLPSGYTAPLEKIVWSGETYAFYLRGDGGFDAELVQYSQEAFDYHLSVNFTNVRYLNEYVKKESRQITSDVTATAYYFDFGDPAMDLMYSFTNDGITYYVQERYKWHRVTDGTDLEMIMIFQSGNGLRLIACLIPPSSRSSLDKPQWGRLTFEEITQFGMKKYVETEVS